MDIKRIPRHTVDDIEVIQTDHLYYFYMDKTKACFSTLDNLEIYLKKCYGNNFGYHVANESIDNWEGCEWEMSNKELQEKISLKGLTVDRLNKGFVPDGYVNCFNRQPDKIGKYKVIMVIGNSPQFIKHDDVIYKPEEGRWLVGRWVNVMCWKEEI